MSLGSLSPVNERWSLQCWPRLSVCRNEILSAEVNKVMTMRHLKKISILLALLALLSVPCAAQKQRLPVCSQTTFTAFRRLPELSYQCPQRFDESDEEILKVPERIAALNRLAGELESFR